jgi:soluble lytic murein transglycosylase
MNLSKRSRLWRRGLGAIALVAPLAFSPQAAAQGDSARADFVAAEKALARGDSAAYIPLKQRLRGYPLYPYLEYGELRDPAASPSSVRVLAFLRDYADSPLSGNLRRSWIDGLAREGRWTEIIEAWAEDESLAVRCHYANALIQTGRRDEGSRQMQKLWLTGDALPDACDAAARAWQAAGGLTPTLTWERIVLAFDKGNETAARAAGNLLPAADEAWLERWFRLRKTPQLALDPGEFGASHPARDDMLADGVRRIARTDPMQALDAWETLRARYPFSPEAQRRAELHLAIALAREDSPRAFDFIRNLKPAADDLLLQEARVRAALLHYRWPLVARWLDDLPAEERNGERWSYWRARAREALGERSEAQAIYARLARENSYYGFLAADRAGLPYALAHRPASAASVAALRAQPFVQRAAELRALGRDEDAKREWRWQYNRIDKQDLQGMARIAKDWGWHDQAAYTLARAGYWDDYEIRFPMLYRDAISGSAGTQGLDSAWVLAVVRQESTFVTDARSSAGAVGLMQLMPATAAQVARKQFGEPAPRQEQLTQPERNVRLGSAYLRSVLDGLRGNPVLATAAYNAGPGRVRQWLPLREVDADIWVEHVPFKETQDYVRRVLAYTVFYEHRLSGRTTRMSERMPLIAPTTNVARRQAAEEAAGPG